MNRQLVKSVVVVCVDIVSTGIAGVLILILIIELLHFFYPDRFTLSVLASISTSTRKVKIKSTRKSISTPKLSKRSPKRTPKTFPRPILRLPPGKDSPLSPPPPRLRLPISSSVSLSAFAPCSSPSSSLIPSPPPPAIPSEGVSAEYWMVTCEKSRNLLNTLAMCLALIPEPEDRQTRELFISAGKCERELRTALNDSLELATVECARPLPLDSAEFEPRQLVACTLLHPPDNPHRMDIRVEVATYVPRFIKGDPYRISQLLSKLIEVLMTSPFRHNPVVMVDVGYHPHSPFPSSPCRRVTRPVIHPASSPTTSPRLSFLSPLASPPPSAASSRALDFIVNPEGWDGDSESNHNKQQSPVRIEPRKLMKKGNSSASDHSNNGQSPVLVGPRKLMNTSASENGTNGMKDKASGDCLNHVNSTNPGVDNDASINTHISSPNTIINSNTNNKINNDNKTDITNGCHNNNHKDNDNSTKSYGNESDNNDKNDRTNTQKETQNVVNPNPHPNPNPNPHPHPHPNPNSNSDHPPGNSNTNINTGGKKSKSKKAVRIKNSVDNINNNESSGTSNNDNNNNNNTHNSDDNSINKKQQQNNNTHDGNSQDGGNGGGSGVSDSKSCMCSGICQGYLSFTIRDFGPEMNSERFAAIVGGEHLRGHYKDMPLSSISPRALPQEGVQYLGLYVCHKLVTATRGRLVCTSVGGVASITAYMPCAPCPQPKPAVEVASLGGKTPRGTFDLDVLVVDDMVANRRLMQTLFQRLGCSVAIAADGLQALQEMSIRVPDVVFSDVHMPVLDGFGFIEAARNNGHDMPIFALTAAENQEARIMSAGFDACLLKPVSLRGLRDTLRQYCGDKMTGCNGLSSNDSTGGGDREKSRAKRRGKSKGRARQRSPRSKEEPVLQSVFTYTAPHLRPSVPFSSSSSSLLSPLKSARMHLNRSRSSRTLPSPALGRRTLTPPLMVRPSGLSSPLPDSSPVLLAMMRTLQHKQQQKASRQSEHLHEHTRSEESMDEDHVEEPTGKFLLVEDNVMNQIVMKKIIRVYPSITVEVANHGATAIKMLERNRTKYAIIFMDLIMPVMDGLTATRKIRAMGITTPIVAVTADVGSRLRCTQAGMDEFLCKPITTTALVDALEKLGVTPKLQGIKQHVIKSNNKSS